MDDLDKYLNEQLKNEDFKREWEESQLEFEAEEEKIKQSMKFERTSAEDKRYVLNSSQSFDTAQALS